MVVSPIKYSGAIGQNPHGRVDSFRQHDGCLFIPLNSLLSSRKQSLGGRLNPMETCNFRGDVRSIRPSLPPESRQFSKRYVVASSPEGKGL